MSALIPSADVLRHFRETHPLRALQSGPDRWDYVSGGTGERVILLVGGAGSTAESMFLVNAALESCGCRVVSVGIPASVTSVEQLTQGIHAILDSLEVPQVNLLGHSLGGMIVQSFAVRYPQRVAGLVLSNTGFYLGARATLMPAASSLMARAPEGLLLRSVASQLRRLLSSASDGDFWLDFYRAELSLPDAATRVRSSLILIARLARFFRDAPIRSTLPWVQAIPVQIITSEDDRGYTKKETAFLAELYPNSQTTTLPKGTGHLSFLTKPDEYIAAVKKLLARLSTHPTHETRW